MTLDPDELPDLRELNDMYQKTKGNLFFKKGAGFLSRLLVSVDFSWNTDLPTAAISPDTLYWNPYFFSNLDLDSRVTVLAHELLHNGLLHPERIGNRDPELYNIAGDHVINLWLQKHGYYMGGFPYIMDPKYEDWSTDDVYDDLLKLPKLPRHWTLHGDLISTDGTTKEKSIATVLSAITTARMGQAIGDVPGEVLLTMDSFLRPKLPWEVLLRNYMSELVEEERSYARPNRRYDDPILPGRTGRNGLEHLLYGVDVSGSVTDKQVLALNTEVAGIKADLNPELLTLVTFDEVIQDTYVFEADDPFEQLVITGRGGTNLKPLFKMIKEVQPSCAVIFTDLFVDIPPDPGVPILWVCVDNPTAKPPFGSLVHISS